MSGDNGSAGVVAGKRRLDDIKRTGCIPCLLEGLTDMHPDVHHSVEQAYRRGDIYTYGNCPWHHRGVPWEGLQAAEMERLLGPSMRLSSRSYREKYGQELDLIQVQNYVLHLFAREPWDDYNMPGHIARQIREFWKELRERNG